MMKFLSLVFPLFLPNVFLFSLFCAHPFELSISHFHYGAEHGDSRSQRWMDDRNICTLQHRYDIMGATVCVCVPLQCERSNFLLNKFKFLFLCRTPSTAVYAVLEFESWKFMRLTNIQAHNFDSLFVTILLGNDAKCEKCSTNTFMLSWNVFRIISLYSFTYNFLILITLAFHFAHLAHGS